MKKELVVKMSVKEFMGLNEGFFQMECIEMLLNGKKMKKADKFTLQFRSEEKLHKESVKQKKPKTEAPTGAPPSGDAMFA